MVEQHLFIIWKNALYKKDEILKDIEKTFKILRVYKIKWSDKLFSQNLSRFYGTNLPKNSGKEKHCGNGSFLLIVVEDKNPRYKIRETSKGQKKVNINMFDKKTYYRKITGGGHKIHATDTIKETNHNLTLLLDKSIEDFIMENNTKWDGKTIELKKDLFGSNKWINMEELFYALNNCVNYAILRNYEELPEEIYINEHNDIDLMCESFEDCAYVLNAKKVFEEENRVHYKTLVQNKDVFFDLRYIGDDYYCKEWEKEILRNKVYNSKGFYTIDDKNYFYALLYHALIHKIKFSPDYKEKLIKLNPKYTKNYYTNDSKSLLFLSNWLDKKKYLFVRPIDKTVYFNEILLNTLKISLYKRIKRKILNAFKKYYIG